MPALTALAVFVLGPWAAASTSLQAAGTNAAAFDTGLPTLSAQAVAEGLRPGGGTPMNWRSGVAKQATATPITAATVSSTTTTQTITTAAATTGTPTPQAWLVPGLDISSYTGDPDWASFTNAGFKFVFIKATEGSSYISPYFNSQYTGATNAGMIRGAYHFANPSGASGTAQADYFVHNGGGWSGDGITLPGVLDIEYSPYQGQNSCYNLTPSQMIAWITDFNNEYKNLTGVWPIIYTTTNWWKTCTGNTSAFATTNPFWVANYPSGYSTNSGPLPAGYTSWTFWQSSSDQTIQADYNAFHGTSAQLTVLATQGTAPLSLPLPGTDRIGTSILISQRQYVGHFVAGTGSVYVVDQNDLPDAMTAGSLLDGPVLLLPGCGSVPANVADEIARLNPRQVVGLGGTGVLCDSTLSSAAAGRPTSRLAGADRIGTAVAIAQARAQQGTVGTVYLAGTANNSPDAAAAGQLNGVILLVPSTGTAPASVTQEINTLGPAKVVAIGGTGAVADSVLTSAAGTRPTSRIAGTDRFETATKVARSVFGTTSSVVYLANGENLVDAVASGSLTDGAVVLVPGCGLLPTVVSDYLAATHPQEVITLGGPGAVCSSMTAAAQAAAAR